VDSSYLVNIRLHTRTLCSLMYMKISMWERNLYTQTHTHTSVKRYLTWL